jgi:hypothetical protein
MSALAWIIPLCIAGLLCLAGVVLWVASFFAEDSR